MSEVPFKNREIRDMFDDVKNSLIRIETQTTTTNGRVSKLENWRSFISGGMAVIVLIVVPILAWALYVLSHIDTTVHQSVDQALSAYNIVKGQ